MKFDGHTSPTSFMKSINFEVFIFKVGMFLFSKSQPSSPTPAIICRT